MIKYGVCKCGKWGVAPSTFKESKHFLKCPSCGSAMYLDSTHPSTAGYPDQDRVFITEFIHHGG